MFRKTGGIFVLVALLGLSVFLMNCGSSNSRPAGVLFVVTQGAALIDSYAINLGNGDLSQLHTGVGTCTTQPCGAPLTIILDKSGSKAFVLNQGSPASVPPVPPSIYGYSVNSNGSLSGAGDVSTSLGLFTPGDSAIGMARDANSQFLFVVTQGNQNVTPAIPPHLVVFGTQSGSTSLTAMGTPLALTRIPSSISAVTATITNPPNPNTQQILLYVTSIKDLLAHNDNTLSEYAVDSSGNVTEQTNGGSPLVTGTLPSYALPVFNASPQPNTLFVFVDDGTPADNIISFQVCVTVTSTCTSQDVANFRIAPTGQAATAVGLSPLQMITDPTNTNLYVANSGSATVSSFVISPTTGKLTALNPANVSTGATPVALTMHPNGEFLYVANAGSGSGTGSVSGFSVNINNGTLSGGLQISSSPEPSGLVAK
jgi:DNA-binding beta-propeller fold protein YncE